MKTKSLILGVSAAGALLSTPAVMAQSAVSLPVGYASTTLSGEFNFVAPNFANPRSFAGSIGSDLAGAFTDGEFNAGSVNPSYYIEIASGANEGARSDIQSNTATVLTLVADGGADFSALLGGGTDVVIRKHVTIQDAFGGDGTASPASLQIDGGASVGDADNILIFNGAGFDRYFYNTLSIPGVSTPGWSSASNADAANSPIYPGEGLVIVDTNLDSDVVTFVGHVKATRTLVELTPGFTLVGLPVALNSNVSGSFGGVAGGVAPADLQLTGGASAGAADNILAWNGAGFNRDFYNTLSIPGVSTPGWDADLPVGFSDAFFVQIQDGNPTQTWSIDLFQE